MTRLVRPAATPADALQTEFLRLLPAVAAAARAHHRHVPCPDRRADLTCEALGLAWVWFLRLRRRGRTPADFAAGFARMAARAALAGRRVCGGERAKDPLSPVCWRWHDVSVALLPDGSGRAGTAFAEALADNTATPVPDQVQFRLDFPRWRASLCSRTRRLLDAMAEGHRTTDLAGMFGVTPARVSQLRRELHDGWRAFCGDDGH